MEAKNKQIKTFHEFLKYFAQKPVSIVFLIGLNKKSIHMHTFLIRLSFLALSCLFGSGQLQAQGVLYIETKDLHGNTSSISEVAEGKLIVLDFWATWCAPCVKSIPKLVQLSDKYDIEIVSFVGINEDSPRNTNKVRPFAQSMGISYPVLLDPDQEIMSELMVYSFPTLVLINSEGKVLFTHEGYTAGDEYLIEEEINKLLKKHE